ncbi:MAG TPA: Spy/CpxP family protein refolding chaperone [Thiobacillus sp.]|nr:Spy/CpxP family protein refolding chaperone [Thiobacillus sp.]
MARSGFQWFFCQQQDVKELQMNTSMKTLLASSIAACALAGTAVSASAAEPAKPDQKMMMQGQAQGSGAPGAMPGYGMGMMHGGMGPGYGMGPGMGMMGGCPMGMMSGGMGPGMGMMGGGMGPGMGMMGGGMGPGMGMMGGCPMGMMGGGMGPMAMLDLSDAQTAQLKKIQTESKQKQRTLMRQMWEEQDKMSDLYDAEKRDPAAIGKAYGKLADLQRQALEARIEMENKMAEVLTQEQKAKMRRGFGRGMMGN